MSTSSARADSKKSLKTTGRREAFAEKIFARLLYSLLAAIVAFAAGYKQGHEAAQYEAYMEWEAPETKASR